MRGACSRKTCSGVTASEVVGAIIACSRGSWRIISTGTPPASRESAMPFRAVFFDFDGTLADSFAAITASTNHVRASYGLPPLPESEVRQHVGYGLPHLMAKLVPGQNPDEAVTRYREHHPSVMLTGTKLMPGVAETIPKLHQRG